MNSIPSCGNWAWILLMSLLLTGCERRDAGAKAHHHHSEEAHADEDGHSHHPDEDGDHDHDGHDHASSHSQELVGGASYQSERGVILSDDTRKILGVEVEEATQGVIPHEIRFSLQMFGEKHRHAAGEREHPGCDVHGSGLIESSLAKEVRVGSPVVVRGQGADHPPLAGVVLGVSRALALGESEVVVGISNAIGVLGPGDFVGATLMVPRLTPAPVVPATAVLRTAQGEFVFVEHKGAYRRQAVVLGAESGGQVAVVEGLRDGERVVIRPVEELWLIELRATKGGGHSH
ncbi:MAG: hypothetical protein JNK85_23625 [Verrucomicrobiales bacterium]|nr:hypothetical protein [Verrucomicrobiales bacterium]